MNWLSLLGDLGKWIGKFGSRKFLLATLGNFLVGLFVKWILGKASALGPAATWAGILASVALAIGLWVYIVMEGLRDREIARMQDPLYRGKRYLQFYIEAASQGLDRETILKLLEYAQGPPCKRKREGHPES